MSGKQFQPQFDSIMANPLMRKPSLEEVRLEAARQGLPNSEADKLYWHYESNGWKVGKTPMRSWKAAMSGWRVRWQERRATTQSSSEQSPTTSAGDVVRRFYAQLNGR